MKVKKFLSGLLACMLLTACSDQDLQKEFEPGEKNIQVELDVDLLTETYGPALTRSIAHLDGISTFALPAGITAINIIPDGEIPAAGETKTIIVSGSFTSILIRATDAVNATTIREIAVVNAGGMGYGTMVIPPYESTELGSMRVVIFEYYNYTNNSWEMFNYALQNAVIVTPFSVWSDITGDIPKEGGNYTINISGNFPSQSSEYVFFQAVDQSNNLVSSSTVAIVGNTQKSVSLTINPNTLSSSRVIYLQYKKSTDSDFTSFETHVQSTTPTVVPDDFTITNNIPATIPANGGAYYLYLDGTFSGSQIAVWAYDTQTNSLLTGYTYLNAANRNGTITIPNNNSLSGRTVGVKYSIDYLASEKLLGTFSQSGSTIDNPKIPGTNIYVAKAKASGGAEMLYSTAIGTGTGCNAYFENPDGSDRGLWRVPTAIEGELIMKYNKQNWQTFEWGVGRYWITEFTSPNPGYPNGYYQVYSDLSSSIMPCRDPITASVRCVRE